MKDNAARISPSAPRSVVRADLSVLDYLCARARPDEIDQFEALTGTKYNPEAAAVGFWSSGPWSIAVAHPSGEPAAAGGYEEVSPGLWQSWMVGTEKGWDEMWIDIHRATRFLTEKLVDSGVVRRLQTTALAERTEARRWYERLGLHHEGTMRGMAYDGRDVVMYGRHVPAEEVQ